MKLVLIALAVSVCATVAGVSAAAQQQASESQPRVNPTLCLDAAGLGYSRNAMVKVNDQIQRCDGGNRWIASLPDFSRDAAMVAASVGKRDCVGKHAELYESGLFRQNEKQVERCDDGEWIRMGSTR